MNSNLLPLEQLRSRFDGATALVFAPGPSLPKLWAGRSSDHPKICINDAYRDWRTKGSLGVIVPDADICYSSDAKWWRERRGLPEFQGVKVCLVPGPPQAAKIAEWPEIIHLKYSPIGIIDYEPRLGLICHGSNSGFAAIHLAAQLGSKLIAMVGFDWHGTHYFGAYPPTYNSNPGPFAYAPNFRVLMGKLAAIGVELVNCTPGSALTFIPPVPLDAVLARKAA